MSQRRSLYHRNLPMAVDVADAIKALIDRDDQGIPLALTIGEIAAELVHIASIDDEGVPVILPVSARNATLEKFSSHLLTSTTFKAGYKQYEFSSRNQVVPVTDFFFRSVYTDEARDCLESMTEYTLMKSLPARPSRLTDANGNPLNEEDDYADARSGRTKGIVIFPNNHRIEGQSPKLVTAWMGRSAVVTVGSIKATGRRIENTGPPARQITSLKKSTKAIAHSITVALPKESPHEK